MEKFFLLSKTFQGIFMMMVPVLAQLAGWEFWTEEDTASTSGIVTNFIGVVGAAWAMYGRVAAEGKVTATP